MDEKFGYMQRRWLISDIAKELGVEAHVLRYWEKELNLEIPRNELGHRFYTDEHVEMFRKIHQLKDAGYQLRAVKKVINHEDILDEEGSHEGQTVVRNDVDFSKIDQFKEIMKEILLDVVNVRDEELAYSISDKISEKVSEKVSDTVSVKVIKQMDYLLRMNDEEEDERFRQLDDTIRSYQRERQEAAATRNGKNKKERRHRFFRG